MRGWHFFNQLRKLYRSQTPQCTDIHMPERFSFTDQTSPGAYLLPMPQTGAKGSLLMVNEGRHDTSLMTLRRNAEKQRSGFGEMKQKECLAVQANGCSGERLFRRTAVQAASCSDGRSTATTEKASSEASRSLRRRVQAPLTGSFQRNPASLAS